MTARESEDRAVHLKPMQSPTTNRAVLVRKTILSGSKNHEYKPLSQKTSNLWPGRLRNQTTPKTSNLYSGSGLTSFVRQRTSTCFCLSKPDPAVGFWRTRIRRACGVSDVSVVAGPTGSGQTCSARGRVRTRPGPAQRSGSYPPRTPRPGPPGERRETPPDAAPTPADSRLHR